MKKLIFILLFLGIVSNAWGLDIDRYRQLPSCVLAEDLSSIEDLERKGWTVAGNPTIAETAYGKAIDLDGTGDYIRTLREYTLTTMSVCGIARLDTQVNYARLFEYEEDNDNTIYVYYSTSSSVVVFEVETSNVLQASIYTTTAPTDRPFSWCFTLTSNEAKFYIDGSQVLTTDTTVTLPTITDEMYFGANSAGSNNFNGKIQDILVFDRVLSAQEISDIYNGTTFDYWQDLVSHWDMSEINPQDIGWKGNANNGTGTGLAAATDIVFENGDWVTEFNGTDEKVTVSDADSLDFGTGDFSYFATIKTTVDGNDGTRFIGKEGTGPRWYMRIQDSDDSLLCLIDDDTTTELESHGTDINDNTWYFVGCVVDITNSLLKPYVDGVVDPSPETLSTMLTLDNSNDLLFANYTTGWLDGSMGEVWIFDDALTTTQVEDLYVREGR